ncbi:hypothetical protein K438DRAFT_1975206 [Mycena galopus ATCC 62051]|nr:hypothetical protein K438DRAFT_1975206 [Mycena galopus ATCC 62051]
MLSPPKMSHVCRAEGSGPLFYKPDVRFFCSPSYDPFLFMQDENKKYGFTISLPGYYSGPL